MEDVSQQALPLKKKISAALLKNIIMSSLFAEFFYEEDFYKHAELEVARSGVIELLGFLIIALELESDVLIRLLNHPKLEQLKVGINVKNIKQAD